MWAPAMEMRKMGHKAALLWYKHDQFKRPDFEWEIDNPEIGWAIRKDLDMACEWGDVVVWMAVHTPSALKFYEEMRLKHSGKPFLLELDDIVFDVPGYNVGSQAYYPGSPLSEILLRQIKGCDGIIVSTPFLKKRLEKYHQNIRVVENTIDSSLWRRSPPPRRRRINIGWVGGATHEKDLALIKNVVQDVCSQNKHVRFKILHGCPEFFKHTPDCSWLDTNDPRYHKGDPCPRCGGLPMVQWSHKFTSIDKYPEWVSKEGFDIGIAPLLDNTFNRAKSNLRWLEYSAMGIPTVASPVENFKLSIVDGKTGLFADSPDEWVSQLTRLINDPQLRASIGKSALNEVRENWTPRKQAEKYLRTIEEITNAEPNAGFTDDTRQLSVA